MLDDCEGVILGEKIWTLQLGQGCQDSLGETAATSDRLKKVLSGAVRRFSRKISKDDINRKM